MTKWIKAHACGNDFLIVESQVSLDAAAGAALARGLCSRTRGVGADGLELLTWTGERCGMLRLFNADGSVAEISGNGTRCVAAWMAYAKKAPADEIFRLATDAGERACRLVSAQGSAFKISTEMGVPSVTAGTVTLDEQAVEVSGAVVSTGNPHYVVFVDDEHFRVAGHSWQELGSAICVHPDFPSQTNVEFVRIMDANTIEIRIFERGVGPTSSSGTGTCASAAAAMMLRGAARKLRVLAPGGEQSVSWPGVAAEMVLTGPAELIAFGEAFA